MSSEIQVPALADSTIYAVIRNAAGLVWQTTTSSFVTYVDASIGNYDISLTEQGTSSGYYVGNFPTGITTAGLYGILAYRQIGGSPAVSDSLVGEADIDWDGSAEVSPPASDDDLTTRAYVKQHLQISVTTYDGPIDQFITATSLAVIKYLGRGVKATDYTETRNGQGTNWLRVFNPPITEITSVIYEADTDSPTTVDGDEYVYEAATGLLKPRPSSASARGFPEGFQNIEINYSGGWEEVPADIQTAVAMICGIMLYVWNNSFMGITEKAVGDVKIKYTDLFAANGDANLTHPVFGPAVSLLRLYKVTRY